MTASSEPDFEGEIACAADLLNTWCREQGVEEVKDPYHDLALRDCIDRLWAKVSTRTSPLTELENLSIKALKKVRARAEHGMNCGEPCDCHMKSVKAALAEAAARKGGGA